MKKLSLKKVKEKLSLAGFKFKNSNSPPFGGLLKRNCK